MTQNKKIITDVHSQTFLRKYQNKTLKEKIEKDAFYGIIANEDKLFNPLKDFPMTIDNDFSKLMFYYMQKPDYFYLILRVIFGMEGSFPLQCLILKNLYEHRFPILIGSRGLGKCVAGDTWVVTDYGIKRIRDLVPSEQIGTQQQCPYEIRGFRKYQKIHHSFFDGTKTCYKLTLSNGVKVTASLDHPIGVIDKYQNKAWKKVGDIELFDKVYLPYTDIFYKHDNGLTQEEFEDIWANFLETGTVDERMMAAPKDIVVEYCRRYLERSGYCHAYSKFAPNHSCYEESLKTFMLFRAIGLSGKIRKNEKQVQFAQREFRLFASHYGFTDSLYGKIVTKDKSKSFDQYRYCEVREIDVLKEKMYDVYIDSDDHTFETNGIISHNSFSMAIYALLRMILSPGVKIVVTGTGFRQSKIIFEYMDSIYQKAPILQSCFKGGKNGPKRGNDHWSMRLGDSICYALPVGPDGHKIRGMRANVLFCDEFSSMNKNIFEEVMSGFLTVKPEPMKQLKINARDKFLKEYSLMDTTMIEDSVLSNQLVLSGTAYYKFNHFYEYFKKWQEIIYSGGREEKLQEIFGEDYNPDEVDWRDYCIIRIPVDQISSGYIDMDQVNRIKASASQDVFQREFMCVFTDDSDGFFKRSLIEKCVANEKNNIQKKDGQVVFNPRICGDPDKKYVFGVDPAYQGDNFAIVVVELHEDHRRIVYVWTTQANEHKMKLKQGLVEETNYYQYCVRKIRNLMKVFPCVAIGLDSGGGGKTIMEVFRETDNLQTGEKAILPVIDMTQKPKETDLEEGDHILHMINFTSQWIAESNHSMKKDLETRDLLFPEIDSASYVEAEFYDNNTAKSKIIEDNIGDCLVEVEELKKEMGNIMVSETSTGKQKFDSMSVGQGGSSSRARKDRYSALLISNWISRSSNNDFLQARQIFGAPNEYFSNMHSYYNKNLYVGDSPLAKQLGKFYEDE